MISATVIAKTFGADPVSSVILRFALEIAWVEGRLHPVLAEACGVDTGQHICAVCGMRSWTQQEAADCCKPLVPYEGSIDINGAYTSDLWYASNEELERVYTHYRDKEQDR